MSSNYLSADNGVISGTPGIIPQGGSDGTLQLRSSTSAGVLTTALTIDNNQNISTVNPVNLPNTFGFKNRIINGAMMIDQRNSGASSTPSSTGYLVDRWKFEISQASKFTVGQNLNSVTAPVGFSNYLGFQTASAVSIGATDYFIIDQRIEGFNFADMGWGTANAKSVTLSFQVYSSLTGTFGGCISNYAVTRSYPFTYTISSANTWTTVSVTIPGDTGGTWVGASNAGAVQVTFGLGVGSTYSGTAGAWATTSYTVSATGATSVVGTNGATFYITGVQLEKGTTATSFDYRDYGRELIMCQRYFQIIGASFGTYYSPNNSAYFAIPFTMRASPSVSTQGTLSQDSFSGSPGSFTGAVTSNLASPNGAEIYLGMNTSTGISNQAPILFRSGAPNIGVTFSAEL
jgi:hypothetical protein